MGLMSYVRGMLSCGHPVTEKPSQEFKKSKARKTKDNPEDSCRQQVNLRTSFQYESTESTDLIAKVNSQNFDAAVFLNQSFNWRYMV